MRWPDDPLSRPIGRNFKNARPPPTATLAPAQQAPQHAAEINNDSDISILDLPLEIRQQIICHVLSWSPSTPPLLFHPSTNRKLLASIERNDVRLKRKTRRPLKTSRYLRSKLLWPNELEELRGLRTFHLVCKQWTADVEGLMGMRFSDLIKSNRPRDIVEVEKMIKEGKNGGDVNIWPSTLVIALFPRANALPGQARLGPSKLEFAEEGCGYDLIDLHDNALRTLEPRGTHWPPFWRGKPYRYDAPTRPALVLQKVHRHLERWIQAAHYFPAQVRFVKVMVDIEDTKAICDDGNVAMVEHFVRIRDLVELGAVLRKGLSETCIMKEAERKESEARKRGGEKELAQTEEGGEKDKILRKVVFFGEQAAVDVAEMKSDRSGPITERLAKYLRECLTGY